MITPDQLNLKYLRSLGGKPHYMGLGVVKLPIDEKYSFHFYSDRAEIMCEDPHDHRLGFTSTVLKGVLRNHIYNPVQSDTETQYQLTKGACTPGAERTVVMDNVIPNLIATFDTPAGSSYTIHKDTIHSIEYVTPKVVTMLEKQPQVDPVATFLVDKLNPSPCAFSQPKSTIECWDIIAYTLDE